MRAYLYTLEVLIALSAVFIVIVLAMKFAPTKPNVEVSLLQLKLDEAIDYLESTGRLRNLVYAEKDAELESEICLLYTSPSPRDLSTSRMPSSA